MLCCLVITLVLATSAAGAQTPSADELFDMGEPLTRQHLVRAVLARNPEVEMARQAMLAAQAQNPQARALDDPMLSYGMAPLSLGANAAFGQEVRISQRLPFFGKRSLAGQVAANNAAGDAKEVEAVQLSLALLAATLFDDYRAVLLTLTATSEHIELVSEFKEIALGQMVAGTGSQQNVLKAEVELANLEGERLSQNAERQILVAQLNGLLQRHPNAPLPLPADAENALQSSLTLAEIESLALSHRPELAALRHRQRAKEGGVRLAQRQFYPDFEIMASYNSMWHQPEHQWMVGLGLSLPVQLGRRHGAQNQAQAELARLRAEDLRMVSVIHVEVSTAWFKLAEAQDTLKLLTERTLPAAQDNLATSKSSFIAGTGSFLELIDAERALRSVRLRFDLAKTNVSRRTAELQRAVGHMAGLNHLEHP